MDLKNNAMLAWGVAAVLALLLLVTLIATMGNGSDWNDVRDRLREECSDPSEEGRANCLRSLGLLEESLHDVSRDLERGASTTPE